MGWTVTERRRGESLQTFFAERMKTTQGPTRGHLLDLAVVGRCTAYGAYEITEVASGAVRVVALVLLLRFPNGKDGNFAYKDMDESMDPDAIACPRRIFERLTPLPAPPAAGQDSYEYARAWRARVQRWFAARDALQAGAQVVFSPPLAFGNGERLGRLEVASVRPLRFRDPRPGAPGHVRYAVPGIERKFACGEAGIEPAAAPALTI